MAAANPRKKPPQTDAAPSGAAPAATNNSSLTDDSVADLVGCAAEDILLWRDYGDQVVVVTRDGHKLTGAVAENED